jgi:hypothetical protein
VYIPQVLQLHTHPLLQGIHGVNPRVLNLFNLRALFIFLCIVEISQALNLFNLRALFIFLCIAEIPQVLQMLSHTLLQGINLFNLRAPFISLHIAEKKNAKFGIIRHEKREML